MAVFVVARPVYASTYYVDYAGGNDSGNGTSVGTAWKHAPNSTGSTGTAASITIQAGDTVLFKGGVLYRGSVTYAYAGTSGSLITYRGDNWPGLSGPNLLSTARQTSPVGRNVQVRAIVLATATGLIYIMSMRSPPHS